MIIEQDITGAKFGKLIVKRRVSRAKWLCSCDCGKELQVRVYELLKPKNGTKSCGCLRQENATPLTNLEGRKIGRLTVISLDESKTRRKSNGNVYYWLCKCECGSEKLISHRNLTRRNATQSCGCFHKEQLIARSTRPNAGFNKVYNNYVGRSKTYNIPFELSVDEFYALTQKNCFYCGEEPSRISKAWSENIKPFIYNGIDRINSDMGYTAKNSVTCCTRCNYAKGTMTLEDFKNWLIRAYCHLIKSV